MLGHSFRRALGVSLGCSILSIRPVAMSDVKFSTQCDSINPLTCRDALPLFKQIKPEFVSSAVEESMNDVKTNFKVLESSLKPEKANFDVLETMERINYPFEYSWRVVKHLLSVRNSDELRKAHDDLQPKAVALKQEIGQSIPIFKALSAIVADSKRWNSLDEAQQRIITSYLREMKHSGVGLPDDVRGFFNKNAQELATLKSKFQNNVLDSTKETKFLITEKHKIDGLPASALGLASQQAIAAGHTSSTPENGPWLLTMDIPSYLPAMQNIKDRGVREQLYRAYMTRASVDKSDNQPVIARILQLQQDQARILGYRNYAELSLSSKMAPNVNKVLELIEMLRAVAYPAAMKDLEALTSFAKTQNCDYANDIKLWDIPFWSERLREDKYAFKEEDVRPYFTLPAVLNGLFSLCTRLFGITIVSADGETEVWHPDVRFYKICDAKTGEHIASFFLDPYSRPAEKRGGAWMDVCIQRSKVMNKKPVAYLICNSSPPVGDKPALLSFREVETLFHEFGHGLQHMLTRIEHYGAAGINNVEWDAVELPSQFMENWCYDRPTLFGMAMHYSTGEKLPEDLYQKILAAKNFQSGLQMLRQLYFGKLDMELYSNFDPYGSKTVFDTQRELYDKYTVMPPLADDKFLCAFSHIFGGGYSAGYYSYKWAEVMSADAFAAFEENGLQDEAAVQTTGRKFRDTVLSMGGGKHPTEVFTAFRGREPKPDALLRHSGLTTGAGKK